MQKWSLKISKKNLRNNSPKSPNCNFFIHDVLTVKNNEITFLGRKLENSDNLDKIYTKDGIVYISRNTRMKSIKNLSYKWSF